MGQSEQQRSVTGLHAELRRELDVLRELVERQTTHAAEVETQRDRLLTERDQLLSELGRLREEIAAGVASSEAAAGEARALLTEARSLRETLAGGVGIP